MTPAHSHAVSHLRDRPVRWRGPELMTPRVRGTRHTCPSFSLYNATHPTEPPSLPWLLTESSTRSEFDRPPTATLPFPWCVRARQERRERKREPEGLRPELANESGESVEDRNKWAVLTLYEALNVRDVERVQQLLAPDIEWWFHGPPEHQHMMRMLTGADYEETTAATAFQFKPERVAAFGSTVVAEGSGPDADTAWVHAWTIAPDGIITQVREYFNTSLTITRVAADSASKSAASCSSSSSSGSAHGTPVWESSRPERAGKSFPGLVLAI
ncbi:unnamed protein product [Musa banksii]